MRPVGKIRIEHFGDQTHRGREQNQAEHEDTRDDGGPSRSLQGVASEQSLIQVLSNQGIHDRRNDHIKDIGNTLIRRPEPFCEAIGQGCCLRIQSGEQCSQTPNMVNGNDRCRNDAEHYQNNLDAVGHSDSEETADARINN